MAIKKITVTASGIYDVLIGGGLLRFCGGYVKNVTEASKLAVITDDTVDALYGKIVTDALEAEGFGVCKFVFPHGETSKSAKTLTDIWNFLCENNLSRSDCLIALGGGVVGDITGFAAATYLRGIDFIQLPTTLLAQVDSSVGGKTAIDLDGGKNLVGSFKQPKLVLCDTDTLDTLSDDIFIDGMGEVIKYGMIKSESLFAELEQYTTEALRKNKAALDDIIAQCVTIKRDVVEADEFDTGERMLLNFGHTLGHSIEQYYNYTGISHGKAVGIGMRMITHVAEKNGMAETGTYARLKNCLDYYGLDINVEPAMSELAGACINDKKRFGDSINIIICSNIGTSAVKKMPVEAFFAMLSETSEN
ncbi:MAG: 3-dehydroquinate synthase [Oscillospiraceae bacterium]|nr:3-dehydroquinate synthase [Oscillospiraceae bacterium]